MSEPGNKRTLDITHAQNKVNIKLKICERNARLEQSRQLLNPHYLLLFNTGSGELTTY